MRDCRNTLLTVPLFFVSAQFNEERTNNTGPFSKAEVLSLAAVVGGANLIPLCDLQVACFSVDSCGSSDGMALCRALGSCIGGYSEENTQGEAGGIDAVERSDHAGRTPKGHDPSK